MVHVETTTRKVTRHRTWDKLLDHVGENLRLPLHGRANARANARDGRDQLRGWVHDLTLCPTRPQRALLLTGPEASGKTMFHNAMGLLLPANGVVHVPGDFHYELEGLDSIVSPAELKSRVRAGIRERETKLDNARLVVVNDIPAACVRLFEKLRYRDGRFIKWSFAYDHVLRPLPNTIHFNLEPPAIVVPKMGFIHRLEDERDAFQQTLRNYAA